MDYNNERKPRVRAVEAFPTEYQGERMICLRDPLGIADGPVLFSYNNLTLLLLQMFDGEQTIGDIQVKLTRMLEDIVPARDIHQFADLLDEHGYLEGPGFDKRLTAKRQAYLDLKERPPTTTLGEGEKAVDELRRQWKRDREHPLGPGDRNLELPAGGVRGILAPHIDYIRGGYAYAWGYRALATASNARVFVILGTIHRSMDVPFAVTRKPFRTPLGLVPVEQMFIDRLRERYQESDLLGDEFAHSNEHSIELQALYLQNVLADRKEEWRIVPILVDSFEGDVQRRRFPKQRSEVRGFLDALRETIGSFPAPVCVIGGVDFAHVGPRFGGDHPLRDDDLERVARQDHAMLDTIERVDPEAFVRGFFADGNARNVCSVAPIYCVLEAMNGAANGTTLRYGQAVDSDRNGAVTFGSVVFTAKAN